MSDEKNYQSISEVLTAIDDATPDHPKNGTILHPMMGLLDSQDQHALAFALEHFKGYALDTEFFREDHVPGVPQISWFMQALDAAMDAYQDAHMVPVHRVTRRIEHLLHLLLNTKGVCNCARCLKEDAWKAEMAEEGEDLIYVYTYAEVMANGGYPRLEEINDNLSLNLAETKDLEKQIALLQEEVNWDAAEPAIKILTRQRMDNLNEQYALECLREALSTQRGEHDLIKIEEMIADVWEEDYNTRAIPAGSVNSFIEERKHQIERGTYVDDRKVALTLSRS
jgi:hypothetical protein